MQRAIVIAIFVQWCHGLHVAYRSFPEGFKFGAATSSYQIEGAWNVSDKGENIWDRYSHTTKFVHNGDTGDVACDSYNQYKKDVEMLKELGVDFYRFSISWSRILPTGFNNKISQDGVDYYNKLINLLLENGIEPVVTLYHWDLPQPLQDIGGWTNPLIENNFADFAKTCFTLFGDRVKKWITLNEPYIYCTSGYGKNENAPGINLSGIGDYLCVHISLKAHAKVYHLYDEVFRRIQNGRIGITSLMFWYEPEDFNNPLDLEAAETTQQFEFGWMSNPIFSSSGDYPEVMKNSVMMKSIEQGYSTSRLPKFTPEEIEYIKGTYDFLGLNHYSTYAVRYYKDSDKYEPHSYDEDRGTLKFKKDGWKISPVNPWLSINPSGFRDCLLWIKEKYNNPEVIVFENGYADFGDIKDDDRVDYYDGYLNAMLDAIDLGCNVSGYTAWSLMDVFEWDTGYSAKFGLYSVDFSSPDKTRTLKDSGKYYQNVLKSRSLINK